MPSTRDLPNPGIKSRFPALQVDFILSTEPPGKPKNTAVGSLSLLYGIFSTGASDQGSPALQANSLLAESPGKPKNTGVGSLSLLQGIFLTQGSPALQAGSLPAELPGKLKNTGVSSLSLL